MQRANSVTEILTHLLKLTERLPKDNNIKVGVRMMSDLHKDDTGLDMAVAHLISGDGPQDENSVRAIRQKMYSALECIPKMDMDFKLALFKVIREEIEEICGSGAAQILDRMKKTHELLNNKEYDYVIPCCDALKQISCIENERFLNRYQKLDKGQRDAGIKSALDQIMYVHESLKEYQENIKKRALENREDRYEKKIKLEEADQEYKFLMENMKEGELVYDNQTNTYNIKQNLQVMEIPA